MPDLFCQSCGMPLSEGLYGTEKSDSLSRDYCVYCYKSGEFTNPGITIEQMVELCIPHMINKEVPEEQARKMMTQYLPTLKRWNRK